MTTAIKVLGICGSLRQGSYNAAALRAAQALAPPDVTLEIADIADIPLYNEDIRQQGLPPAVEKFRAQIKAADALLFVTPEYNYSIPGVLKNAIDWASRPPEHPFANKPAAIMSASMGIFGGARAQYHLRQMLIFLDMHLLNTPEVMIGAAHERFDAQGKLTHEPTRGFIAKQLAALAQWTRRLEAK